MEDIGIIESETLVRAPRIEVREREEGENYEDEREREKRQKVSEGSANNGGGLLDNLFSKLTSPKTPKSTTNHNHVFGEVNNNPFDHQDDSFQGSISIDGGGGGGDGGGDGGGGGGVINDFISNFFSRSSEGDQDVKNNSGEDVKCRNEGNEVTNKSNKVDYESGNENGGSDHNGGRSIISSLVPEMVAPEGDEASILIHSVVHD